MRSSSSLLLLPLLLGSTAPAPAPAAEPIPLRAGPVTMMFEPDNAFLRYLKVGPHELWRGLYAPVRNQTWATVKPQVTRIRLDQRSDSFTLKFDVLCREGEIDFLWHGTIKGSPEGEIVFTFDGTARSNFLRNRIGFCLLHGPSAAGQPWVIEDIRGEKSKGRFPVDIAPHQPAKDIKGIAHEFAPGRWARVMFEGDTFEMEDQRNWTDASFKTYCTPLALPYPVKVSKGTKVRQTVTFRLDEKDRATALPVSPKDPRVTITLGSQRFALPRLGLQVSSQVPELSNLEGQRLKALHLDHLRVDLTPADSGFVAKLRHATAQAKALQVRLQVGLHLSKTPEAELQQLATELELTRPPVSIWLVIAADAPTFQLARKVLAPHQGDSLLGVGEDSSFVALNRGRPEGEGIQAVSYGINPQIHAFDNASIIETLPIQGDTVRSARRFVGDRQLVITPITLRPQQPGGGPPPGDLPLGVEPRQTSAFAAGWTLGSVKYLAEAGVHSATYYETVGWKGIMESAQGTPKPDHFPSRPGEVFPVYHLLRQLGEFAGQSVQQTESSDPLSVVALAVSRENLTRVLIANLTARPRTVLVRGAKDQSAVVRILETPGTPSLLPPRNTEADRQVSLDQPIALPPHGIVWFDRTLPQ